MDKASKIMSTDYDAIFVQEATELTEDDWESLTTRLRNGVVPFQQLMADCNPSTPVHWLLHRCNIGRTLLINSRHEDNPKLFTEDGEKTEIGAAYIARLDRLTGVRKDRLRYGRWVAAEGVIYEGYDESVHLVERFDVPEDWPRYWSVDFGYTNPFVCQWWAQDPDGRLFLYREIYHTKRLVSDHAKKMLELSKDEPRPAQIICDHDAEGRATLERELGVGTFAAHKAVANGIDAVQERLRVQGDGKPRLMIMRNSLVERDPDLAEALMPSCTAEEIPGYTWDSTPGKPPKETPVKKDDHGVDAMRYVVSQLDIKGFAPRYRGSL